MRDALASVLRRSATHLPTPVFVPRPRRDREDTAAVPNSYLGVSAVSLAVIAALAVLFTLYLARSVVLPLTVAVLLSFLLRSPVRWLRKRGLPEPWGAAVVMLGTVSVLSASVAMLAAPATEWAERAPAAATTLERRLRPLLAPVLRWEATAARVTRVANGRATVPTAAPLAMGDGMVRRLFGSMTNGFIASMSVIFLTYFLLASGDLFMRKLLKVLPYDTSNAVVPQQVSDDVQAAVSRYLRTAVLINGGLGLATWGVMTLLKMPNAGLWGVLAALLNFVPFLGALFTTGILALAAVTVFDSPSRMIMVPLAFQVLNIIESNIVTPLLMGKQFPLNTVALFVGIMFWQFVWGVPGAILAVPIMVTIKLVCDAIPSLHPIAEFLGQ